MMMWSQRLVVLVCAGLVLSGCASNPVKMSRVDFMAQLRHQQGSAYSRGEIGDRTAAVVDRQGLSRFEVEGAIDGLRQPIEGLAEVERLLALAELEYRQADRWSDGSELVLSSARHAAAALDAATAEGVAVALDPLRLDAMQQHNFATTRFLEACLDGVDEAAAVRRRLAEDFGLELSWEVPGPWRLEDFDHWEIADTLRFEGLRHRYRRQGIGVPLVVQRDAASGIPDYLTPEAVTRSVTVVMDGARLRFLDPRTTRTSEVALGFEAPVAADFTAPLGLLLAQANLHALENRSFFSASVDGHEGLYLLEEYDPDRRPVVMVHGLWSSPLTWRDLTNDVFGDATLHQRYQVWHYMYATGAPLLENARQLRETLIRARQELDPEQDDFASKAYVLVGHSMGGLLSRICLSTSGDAVWATLFDKPFDDVEVHLEDRDQELARGLYFWEPLPFVSRVIFIAAPHRGSQLADSWIGRLGSSLMYVPKRLRGLVDRIRGRSGVRVEVPTSVDELSGSHPVMQTLMRLPMREGLVYHSIMGNVEASEDPAEWTDGIVPYASSHLDGSASELVIPDADHGVHFDPRASAEVRRILRAAPSESR